MIHSDEREDSSVKKSKEGYFQFGAWEDLFSI